MMLCPRCQANNVSTANFCGNCGFQLRSGGKAVRADNGSPDDPLVLEVPAKARSTDGERKLITALIVDIKDSVALIGTLDPERAHGIVHSVLGLMIDSAVKFGGHVLQPTGDGIYAVFGVPLASQDHAQQAVYAALEMQSRLHAYAAGRRDSEPLVEARVGIESGEVVLRNLDTGQGIVYITVGQTVNLAARLQSVAPPGSVAVGEQTRRLVEGYFNLRTLPSAVGKGVPHPIAVYEVIGLGRLRRHSQISARRQFSKFVGRDAELLRLRSALDRAVDGGGQVVSIVAEPGIGKSRLLLEFRRALSLDRKIFEAYAVSYAREMPWFPIIGMLQDYFEITDVDGPAVRRAKIESALIPLISNSNEILPFLFGLLGVADGPDPLLQMDPAVRRDRSIEAIIRILLAESDNQPTVLIFEDLHWIDELTKSLLERLATSIGCARILLLTSYRPEYIPNWRDEDNVTGIVLEPLSLEGADSLLSALLGEGSRLSDLKRHISDRTGGNPFFIEEIVNTLFEDGTLRRNETVHLTKPVCDLKVPMTVRGALLERIDQIAPRQKEMLQILAIIGQTLPLKLVFEVSPWPKQETGQLMRDLRAAGFVYMQSDIDRGDDRTNYAFKHALTEEVAYETMLGDRRKQLHGRVAETIESVYRDFLDDQIASLAHHYRAADDYPKAIEYLAKAGQQAIQRAAHSDAITFFREALRLAELVPEGTEGERATVWASLGTSLLVTHGYAHEEARVAYGRARDISIKAGDVHNLALVLRGLFLVHISTANYESALRTGQEMLALGSQDESCLLEGRVIQAIASIYTGQLRTSESFFTEALGYSNNTPDFVEFQHTGHTYTLCRAYYAICLTYLGKIDRSLSESLDAQIAAEAISVPITTAQTLAARGTNLHRLRYYSEAEACYDQAISCSIRHGIPYWAAFCLMAKAAVVAEREGFEASFADFERGWQDYHNSGSRLIMSWFLYLRAALLANAGKIAEASECIDETIAFITATGETVFEAEVYRFKGTLLLHGRGNSATWDVDDVEACFIRALAVSRQQNAKLWELRAAASFACLRARQSRFAEGYELLGPVYSSFTEGFDAPDLVDARRLIDYLAGGGLDRFPKSDVAGSAFL
jgi:class 3 adenylate cyclase/tetratricopeptide (TPR) repeat protein